MDWAMNKYLIPRLIAATFLIVLMPFLLCMADRLSNIKTALFVGGWFGGICYWRIASVFLFSNTKF